MKQKIKLNGGEMSFGVMIILFLVALFVIWYFTGGPDSPNAEDPFLKVTTPST
jgi:hypothetical protein